MAARMQTEEGDLLKLAEGAKESGDARLALVVDLSGIPHIEDPVFFRTLTGRLEAEALSADTVLYRLPHHMLALVSGGVATVAAETAVKALDEFLHRMGRGGVRWKRFSLARDGDDLARLCRRLIREEAESAVPEAEAMAETKPDDGQGGLADFMRIHEALRNADLANLVREQTIWDFADRAAPRELARALTVSIDELDAMFNQRIRENPWLFEKVMELVDRRMFGHLISERLSSGRTYTVNVTVGAVLSGDLDRYFDALPFHDRDRIIVEVPYVEALHDPAAFERTVAAIESQRLKVALDGVRWNSLPELEVAAERFDYVKVMWDRHFAETDATMRRRLAEGVAAVGPARCILFNCVRPESVDQGLAAGARLLQGRAVDDLLRRKAADTLHERERALTAEALAEEAEEATHNKSILSRLFGDD